MPSNDTLEKSITERKKSTYTWRDKFIEAMQEMGVSGNSTDDKVRNGASDLASDHA